MDKAHARTDRILLDIEKKLKASYSYAYKDVKKQLTEIVAKMELSQGLTANERYLLANKYDRLTKLAEQITDTINNADKEAVRIINGELANIYKINKEQAESLFAKYGVEFSAINKTATNKLVAESISPFDKLAIDNLKSKDAVLRALKQEFTTSIMTGESIPNMAKRIRGVTERNLADSVRIARTETTRVENSARYEVGKQGEKLGFKMKREWVATTDERTREEHADADGQQVDMDEPFTVGGEQLMYPGDTSLGASAGNTINCRCTIKNIIVEESK
ncbi:MAG: phage minor head protein [Bacteroidales bacterium]|nr:phage minor head protein [Bacteroidales bacterium]